MSQLDLCHVFSLNFVNTEADHQVGHHVALLFGFTNDLDRLINIEQYLLEAEQQMQAVLRFYKLEMSAVLHALGSERDPLQQNIRYAHRHRRTFDQNVKVAGEGIFQRGLLKQELRHLFGIGAAFQIYGDLQAGFIGLIADIVDLFQLACLYVLDHLIDDGFARGGGRDLGDIDAVVRFIVGVFATDTYRTATGIIHLAQFICFVYHISAAAEIRPFQRFRNVKIGVFDEFNGGFAYLFQIKRADVACHTHGDTRIGIHQYAREPHREKRGLLHRIIVVRHKTDSVFFNIGKQLAADGVQLCLRITGGGVLHIL